MSDTCVFCLIAQNKLPAKVIMQTENVIVFQDRSPRAPVHFLVVPKQHVTNINAISDEQGHIALEMMHVVQSLARDYGNPADSGFNLIANNGTSAGQVVLHMHWHFLSGKNIYAGGFSL